MKCEYKPSLKRMTKPSKGQCMNLFLQILMKLFLRWLKHLLEHLKKTAEIFSWDQPGVELRPGKVVDLIPKRNWRRASFCSQPPVECSPVNGETWLISNWLLQNLNILEAWLKFLYYLLSGHILSSDAISKHEKTSERKVCVKDLHSVGHMEISRLQKVSQSYF